MSEQNLALATTAAPDLDALASAASALFGQVERTDLTDRLDVAVQRRRAKGCTIVVVGEFKMGKSSLVNAIINAPLSPTDDDVATAKPVEVHYADEPTATVVYRLLEDEVDNRTREIEIEEVESYMLEPPSAPDAEDCALVRIGLPRKLFADGMSMIDTPGVGGLGSTHSARTLGVLSMADAVLFVSDAAQELTAPELEFFDLVRDICPTIAMVMPKVDFYPHWRQIDELNRGHLALRGIDMEIFAISSTLRQIAIAQNNAALNEESGYKELVAHLRGSFEQQVNQRSSREMCETVGETLDDLRSQLLNEAAILNDPDAANQRMEDLEAQCTEAEDLRGRAARWQQTLADGVGDLTSDIDHDLRARFRDLIRDVDTRLDEEDPANVWDDFSASATSQVNRAVAQNFGLLHQRTVELGEQVATHFGEDHASITGKLSMASPGAIQNAPEYTEASISKSPGVLGSGVTALRGSVGGFVMVGIIGSAVAITPAVWVAPVVAALIGRKTRKDEAKRALEKRQREAKQVIRKYIDEAQFVAAKDARDSVRHVNRQLREGYLERAEEVKRSTNETLAAAKTAMQVHATERNQRAQQINTVVAQLEDLSRHVEATSQTLALPVSA
jgi:hypothetical protein